MTKAWIIRKAVGEKLDKFCHDCYYRALECGELGTYSVHDFRAQKIRKVDEAC